MYCTELPTGDPTLEKSPFLRQVNSPNLCSVHGTSHTPVWLVMTCPSDPISPIPKLGLGSGTPGQ